MQSSLLLAVPLLFFLLLDVCEGQVTPLPRNSLTPIPENANPRIEEFHQIDTDHDKQLTFTEFLLGDRPYMERQSKNFHQLDLNDDGVISLKEFEDFYTRRDEEKRRRHEEAELFFRQLGPGGGFDSPFFGHLLPSLFEHRPPTATTHTSLATSRSAQKE